jgi:hypothetical protein
VALGVALDGAGGSLTRQEFEALVGEQALLPLALQGAHLLLQLGLVEHHQQLPRAHLIPLADQRLWIRPPAWAARFTSSGASRVLMVGTCSGKG